MTNKVIDIGVNLMHASFQNDREEVVSRARNAGVEQMIITGTSLKSSQIAAKYAEGYPDILYATAGVHPHDARHCSEQTIKQIRELAAHGNVVAIGECGLDFNRDFSPRPVQEKWFEAQIELACDLKLPLFLHEREAHQRFVEILAKHRARFDRAVVHCFTGTERELDVYLDMGFHIGITGWICDERRGLHLRELIKKIPYDRLMIETDAPFLTPRDLRPKPVDGRNEPAFLLHVLRTVAHCLEESEAEMAETVTQNTIEFFAIP